MNTIERYRKDILYLPMMLNIYFRLRAFLSNYSPRGQGLVEYALLILLVGLAVIVMLALFGRGVGNMFSNIISNV
jgi:Flp pilus assembly pilin Flp